MPRARKEMREHTGWEIWDQRDLTNKVRSLPTHEARALLDDHLGGGVRRVVLPAADSDAFIGLDDHFGPLLTQGRIFHHRTDLLGRSDVLGQLSEALRPGAAPKIIVVTGPGGRGKSRVALEVLRSVSRPPPVSLRRANTPTWSGSPATGSEPASCLRSCPASASTGAAPQRRPSCSAGLRSATRRRTAS